VDYSTIRTLRRAKGMTLEKLANKVGTTSSYLSLVERNKREPTNKLIEDICRELDCELIVKLNM